MNREEKAEKVKRWHAAFADVTGAVFTGVSKIKVGEVTDLRRRFREAQVSYEVVKNTLARRALDGTEMDVARSLLDGPTGVAWSHDDPAAPARIAAAFAREVDRFEIRGGYAGGRMLDQNGVKALATMPSFDELRAQLLGVIEAVPARLMAQINAPAQQITGVVQARKEDLEKTAA